jgi:hypothetical protein
MALISMHDDGPPEDYRMSRAWQQYLASLERKTTPEPFVPRGETELVDGPVRAPKPERPKRPKRKQVKLEPVVDRERVSLQKYARKLKGET